MQGGAAASVAVGGGAVGQCYADACRVHTSHVQLCGSNLASWNPRERGSWQEVSLYTDGEVPRVLLHHALVRPPTALTPLLIHR